MNNLQPVDARKLLKAKSLHPGNRGGVGVPPTTPREDLSQPLLTEWTDLPELSPADGLQPCGLKPKEIHLWLIHLQASPAILATCATLLSPDEAARARRFRFQHLRDRYTVAHGALRQILASCLATPAATLRFIYGPQGKPALDQDTPLTFNLSHSQDLALLAITRDDRIGIDLEDRVPNRDLAQLAARNFTSAEAAALAALPIDQRADGFYACWTLKEAYVKATGEGLSTPLDTFEVLFPPASPPRLAHVASGPEEHLRWQAHSFRLDRHTAGLVVEGNSHTLYRALWNPPSQSG